VLPFGVINDDDDDDDDDDNPDSRRLYRHRASVQNVTAAQWNYCSTRF